MMGYMMLVGPCFCCHRMFTCNPKKVPSFKNEPICRPCIEYVNKERAARGLPQWPVFEGAYEPEEVA